MLEINEEKKNAIKEIAGKRGLEFVVLYGSQAKGKATPESDIDIAVLGRKTPGLDELIELNNEFADVFKTKEIDVKLLNRTDPLFRFHVTRDGILIFGDRHKYNHYRAYAFRDYHDSHSLFNLKDMMIKKRLKHLTT